MELLEFFILAIFVNNIILTQYLGLCPFLGTSKEKGVAFGMSGAVIVVMLIVAIVTWCLQKYLLTPYELDYLQTIFFIVVIASVVQLLELFLRKVIPPLYKSLGIFLPLITTNCAVLGVAISAQRKEYDLETTIYFAIGMGLGFALALALMSGLRERLRIAHVPRSLEGTPVALLIGGIMALSFLALKGVVL
ncbi:MAG: RnfABCDGE type electron transport complex subunit A [Desulfovibrionaceae bacterium]|nr:RnfABCDGE type electron transport complex subunit A [Desulfovibrionaceae bacterium]